MIEIENIMPNIPDPEFYTEIAAVADFAAGQCGQKRDAAFGINADTMKELAPLYLPQVGKTFIKYKLGNLQGEAMNFYVPDPDQVKRVRALAIRRRTALEQERIRLLEDGRRGRCSYRASIVAVVVALLSLVWEVIRFAC